MPEIIEKGGNLFIRVRVQPRASTDGIVGEHAGGLKLKVRAVPEKGKANRAAVEILAKSLGVAGSRVRLARGERSRDKVFEVKGMGKESALKALSDCRFSVDSASGS